jgi:hypothetical protein
MKDQNATLLSERFFAVPLNAYDLPEKKARIL